MTLDPGCSSTSCKYQSVTGEGSRTLKFDQSRVYVRCSTEDNKFPTDSGFHYPDICCLLNQSGGRRSSEWLDSLAISSWPWACASFQCILSLLALSFSPLASKKAAPGRHLTLSQHVHRQAGEVEDAKGTCPFTVLSFLSGRKSLGLKFLLPPLSFPSHWPQ